MFQKTHTSTSGILLLQVSFFLCLFALSNAVRVKLSENFLLDYNLTGNSQIEFKIQAINVTGWIGLGINNRTGELKGSDLYVGGFNETTGLYGEDCYVPINSTDSQPVIDDIQNWKKVSASEINGTTTLTLSRLLNTTDQKHDLVIQNKTMFLIWLYNDNSDNRTMPLTHKGSMAINLLNNDANGRGSAANNFGFAENSVIIAAVSLTAVMINGNF